MAMTNTESSGATGTKDKDYDVIWFTEACLSNALRLETSPGTGGPSCSPRWTGSVSCPRCRRSSPPPTAPRLPR